MKQATWVSQIGPFFQPQPRHRVHKPKSHVLQARAMQACNNGGASFPLLLHYWYSWRLETRELKRDNMRDQHKDELRTRTAAEDRN